HRTVSDLLDAVEAAAAALGAEGSGDTREHLRAALEELADVLLAHLAFEEEAISPTLRELTVPPWMVPGAR
ncbi:MAG: Hemerythrin cation binding protein, partial [Thermoleophilia bacterium]|nr:Hemerythrin cation binding protein [Thermoleophilia bacterium]